MHARLIRRARKFDEALAAALPKFELTLSRGGKVIDRGVGSNVLDSPALASLICWTR